jgi:hypothetical protein
MNNGNEITEIFCEPIFIDFTSAIILLLATYFWHIRPRSSWTFLTLKFECLVQFPETCLGFALGCAMMKSFPPVSPTILVGFVMVYVSSNFSPNAFKNISWTCKVNSSKITTCRTVSVSFQVSKTTLITPSGTLFEYFDYDLCRETWLSLGFHTTRYASSLHLLEDRQSQKLNGVIA